MCDAITNGRLRLYCMRELRAGLRPADPKLLIDRARMEVALNVLYYLDGGTEIMGPLDPPSS